MFLFLYYRRYGYFFKSFDKVVIYSVKYQMYFAGAFVYSLLGANMLLRKALGYGDLAVDKLDYILECDFIRFPCQAIASVCSLLRADYLAKRKLS